MTWWPLDGLRRTLARWWRGGGPGEVSLDTLGKRFDDLAMRARTAEVARVEAEVADQVEERKARVRMSRWILFVFTGLNAAVMVLVYLAYLADKEFLEFGIITAPGRLISEKVLMALIGATAVQVGVAITAMVVHFFPAGHPALRAEERTSEPGGQGVQG